MTEKGSASKVTISIPTLLAHPSLLQKCLESLENLNVPTSVMLEVVVVSNTSKDKLTEFQKELRLSPKLSLTWIALDKNVGFAAATNTGFRAKPFDYAVCLNDDTQVDPGWLLELIRVQKATGADMVASRIFLSDKKTLDSEGFTFAWRGKAEALRNGKSSLNEFPDHWLKNTDAIPLNNPSSSFWNEPFGPDAAACLYSATLFKKIGMFHESFFAYLEDVELALRARQAGFRCSLAKEAVVYHNKHATSSGMGYFKAKQDLKNWWKIVKRYPLSVWREFYAAILVERVRNISGFLKSAF